MPVGVGARQPGRDLGAIDGAAIHLEVAAQHADVEAGIVEQLEPAGIGEQAAQVRRGIVALGQLHQMGVAIAGRQLHDAQTVASALQPHGLGIDRDRVAEVEPGRQIATVKGDAHLAPAAHDANP